MSRHHHHNHHHHDTPAPQPDPDPAPTPAPTPAAPAFADLGLTFNEATRVLEGGLWRNVVEEGGQGFGSINKYTNDLTTVQQGLQAEIKAGQFSGDTLAHVNTILADITTSLSAATASVTGGGAFGSVAAAEAALRTSHIDILNIVNNDANLAGAAANAGAVPGFLQVPQLLPDGVTAANAPKGTFAEIGLIFNDAANRVLGGVNADNSAAIQADVNAMITGLTDLTANNPLQFGGLTGIHALAIIDQLKLANTYINTAAVNVDVGRGLNDDFLDIIDIVAGDTNLANMAAQNGLNGFTPFGEALTPTPKYIDNDAQTAFWADFIAKSNSIGQAAVAAINAGDAEAIAKVTADLATFKNDVTNFDAAQGGIFQARFDNELLGDQSTLGAEIVKMLEGFATDNKALVAAAADQMHQNAADVGGNNVPTTGGTYNTDGTTVAQVLGTTTTAVAAADAPAAAAPAAPTAPAVAHAAGPTATHTDPAPSHIEVADANPPVAPHVDASHHHAHVHHHMWG